MKGIWDRKGNAMSIDDIAEALADEDDNRLRDLGVQLNPFTSRGNYGAYFIGENTVSFRKSFTVLELESLRHRTDLRRVVLLMLIYRIQQEMFLGDRADRKMLIIDEAWELLGEGEVARFIEGAYRRFRKYNGLVGTITQDLGDLYHSRVGEAITANSANTILLRQKGDVIDRLVAANHVTLSQYEVQLVKSLRTVSSGVPGRAAYSEAYFMTECGRGIGRLIVDDFEALLYSTKGEDVAAIRHYRETGQSVEDAIHSVMRDRGLAIPQA